MFNRLIFRILSIFPENLNNAFLKKCKKLQKIYIPHKIIQLKKRKMNP